MAMTMYDTLKVIDLNPTVPEEQMYELLCEKFANFPDVSINIVQHDKTRIAYLTFKSFTDACSALKENSCIALFGYACRAVPVYDKPGARASKVKEPASSNGTGFAWDSFGKSEDNSDRDGLHPDEPGSKTSPERQSGSYQRRGTGSALWLNRRAGFQRGFRSSRGRRGRGVGRPYLLSSTRVRGKPYFLTKPPDDHEEEEEKRPITYDVREEKRPALLPGPETTDGEKTPREPNSTLYIGSLDHRVKVIDLKRLFNNFGYVLDVEIKHPSASLCFGFVHFLTTDMAQLAQQEMKGKPIGRTVPKLGYGKRVESSCVWVGGLGPWTSEAMLRMEFGQFGAIEKIVWPKNRDYAFVLFANIQDAVDAKQVMHESHHGEPPHQIRVSYASDVQMNSHLNYKEPYPAFPKLPRPENVPKKKIVPQFPEKRKSPDRESREFHRQSKRSPERVQSRSRSKRKLPERSRSHSRPKRRSPERSRSRSRHKRTQAHAKSRRKEKIPSSPYGSSISQVSSDSNLSAISSESDGVSERNRQPKRHQKSSGVRSPINKLLRNPSPPKVVKKDERTVVLRSEPQSFASASAMTSNVFSSGMTQMPSAAVPSYVPSIDPVAYYPPVASTIPPPVYPPPLHIPPPDFYMPPNPVMPQFSQHLPPLVSYPPLVGESPQPMMPVESQPSVAPAQPAYVPEPMTEKKQQDVSPAKPVQKTPNVSVATKFPKVWSGALVLRNAAFVVDFHLLSGSVLLVNSLLGSNVEQGSDGDCPVLKIAQRLRLDQPGKLDELERRLKQAGRSGCSVLLATSMPAQVDDDANVVQQYPLSSLVSYLLQKQVAAIVSLPPGCADAAKATGILHAFPPCPFATEFLHREAPGLPADCPTAEDLLVILCEC